MPPKAKITREMIIDAAYEITREHGAECVNARVISKKLDCSTQPVLYYFEKIEDIKKEVYQKADSYHTAYITDIKSDNPGLDIGLNYIQFAASEKNLFRFLFQSNVFSGKNICDLINSEELQPVLSILCEEANLSTEQAKTVFRSLFLVTHGYASMLANNEMNFDREIVASDLMLVFNGAIYAQKGEMQ